MVMDTATALAAARELHAQLTSERSDLDIIRRYWTGKQPLPLIVPQDAPREVKVMARIARVNVIRIVVESITQSLIVTNIRTVDDEDDAGAKRAWEIWQANGMDARQSGLVRATTAYGTGYGISLPGTPAPVMRSAGPRQMTTMVDADDDVWPVLAWWRIGKARYRLIDDQAVYEYGLVGDTKLEQIGEAKEHGANEAGAPVCPVVRFRDAYDLDQDDEAEPGMQTLAFVEEVTKQVAGQVAPLIELQDQINMTSFGLKAAEWYGAFRQRWMIGKKLDTGERVRSGASQIWSFDDDPTQLTLGEFSQTELRGYLESREDTAKFAAVLSQTPVHELTGQLVNLSAEALAAAEIGRDRMIGERKIGQGESFEQWLRLACAYEKVDLPADAQVTYEDTSARAFGAVVDGLGKIAQMLQVPPQALWSKIPGATKQDVQEWTRLFEEGDAIGQMNDLLNRQMAGGGGERTSPGGIIIPPGAQV